MSVIKDVALSFRAQQQKIGERMRRFFQYAKEKEVKVYFVGQEKTGYFMDHLNLVSRLAILNNKNLYNSYRIPDQRYIQNNVLKRPYNQRQKRGINTHYGGRVLLYYNSYQKLVLDIPTGAYVENPKEEDLMGFERIVCTLKELLSYQYDNALTPIVIANFISSLSNYPSKYILSLFAFTK